MKSTSKFTKNVIAKLAVLIARKIFPEFIKRCPYKADSQVHMENKTLEYKFLSLVPAAVYKVQIKIHLKNGIDLLNVTLYCEIF